LARIYSNWILMSNRRVDGKSSGVPAYIARKQVQEVFCKKAVSDER
jgi:hypothetical protein